MARNTRIRVELTVAEVNRLFEAAVLVRPHDQIGLWDRNERRQFTNARKKLHKAVTEAEAGSCPASRIAGPPLEGSASVPDFGEVWR